MSNNFMVQARLLVAPVLGLLMFANETCRSYSGYSQTRSTCFWWGNFAALDSKPLEKSAAFDGQKPVTECGFQEQGFDRFGLRPSVRLLAITVLPAFMVSLGLAHAVGALGINEIPVFIGSTPVLIFAWYYLVGLIFRRVLRRWQHHRRPIQPSSL